VFGCLANLKGTLKKYVEEIFRGKEDVSKEENTKYHTSKQITTRKNKILHVRTKH